MKPFVFAVLSVRLVVVVFELPLLLVVDDALVLAALFVELWLLVGFVFSLLVPFGLLLVLLFDMLNSLKKRSLFLFSVLVAIRLAVSLFLPDDGEPPFELFSCVLRNLASCSSELNLFFSCSFITICMSTCWRRKKR